MSCSQSQNRLPGEKPQEVKIEIENETYETIRGTYFWNGTCPDTGGPRELLKGKEPILVNPGDSFKIDYKPNPNKFTLIQISESDEEEVSMKKFFPNLHKKGPIIILTEFGGKIRRKRTYFTEMPLCFRFRSKEII